MATEVRLPLPVRVVNLNSEVQGVATKLSGLIRGNSLLAADVYRVVTGVAVVSAVNPVTPAVR